MSEKSTRKRFRIGGSILGLAAMASLSAGAVAQTPAPGETLAPGIETNAAVVTQAVVSHPNVAAARARICGAASRFNQARGEELPQIDFSVRTTSSLSDNLGEELRDPAYRRSTKYDEDVNNTGTDAVIGLDQTLFDWGLTDTRKQIAINDKAQNSIAMRVEIDRVAADIMDLALRVSEQRERLTLQSSYISELEPLVTKIEASVNAGALRLGDLRAIKIIELDAEVARTLSERQATLVESELLERFGLEYDQAAVLLGRFLANRPEQPPQIESASTREVRQLDIQLRTTSLEAQRLKAERYPQLLGNLDLTFFNADEFTSDYELTGGVSMAMPVFDGGSNRSRRVETEWRRRGLESERANLIRQHGNVMSSTLQNIDRAREQMDANAVKKVEVDFRLAEARAREGITVSDPLNIARTLEQSFTIQTEQTGLRHQIELGLLQGAFFADELGGILELPYGGPPC